MLLVSIKKTDYVFCLQQKTWFILYSPMLSYWRMLKASRMHKINI